MKNGFLKDKHTTNYSVDRQFRIPVSPKKTIERKRNKIRQIYKTFTGKVDLKNLEEDFIDDKV